MSEFTEAEGLHVSVISMKINEYNWECGKLGVRKLEYDLFPVL